MRPYALLLPTLVLAATPAHASRTGWADASDVGAYSLMALSIGLPAVKGDGNGALQAAGSLAATSLVTEGLKEAFPTLRPDGSDRKSFPSGHTSRSFAAAAALWNRQGKEIGIPAMVVAAFVGTARVQADKHRWGDVFAGAAIGTAAGFLITKQRPDAKTTLVPWGDTMGGGLAFAMLF
jgi:membrane-associated phospholipid phosphatase